MTENFKDRFAGLRRLAVDWIRTRRRAADPVNTPKLWLTRPGSLANRNVCILVTWNSTPRVSEHAMLLARAWAAEGFSVVLIVSLSDPTTFDAGQDLSFCDGVLLRSNVGYDFGAWAAAIRLMPDVHQARMLVIANDSVFGPLTGFKLFIDRVRQCSADVVGAIDSVERAQHLQSFLIFFKTAALESSVFKRFWRQVRNGDRAWAIRRYELQLQRRFADAGLKVRALYSPATDHSGQTNPTLAKWRELIEQGFPFIKVQLLRDNPTAVDISAWRSVLAEHGYDPTIVDRYLSANPSRHCTEPRL